MLHRTLYHILGMTKSQWSASLILWIFYTTDWKGNKGLINVGMLIQL